ncbi:HAD family phosphatase [Pseudogracilibacillus sp. SE30717A]|uniref:HAD family hydrolase n=1 Tax=Pseudogracilibacillus sp. SE30717A TaxID=3098293 RepID=UPI00300E6CB0
MRVAIFDFDGTLYKKETFNLLMNHLKKHPVYGSRYKSFYRAILLPYLAYKIRVYPERKMKKQLMQRYLRSFSGLTKNELDKYFAEVATEMKEDFSEEVVSKLHDHVHNNDYVMIVSGAFTPLLEAVTLEFPVDEIIGTEIPLQNNTLDEQKDIDHVQAERKNELIHEALRDKQINWENSYAYGDSYSDLSVLNLVGHPVAVCPDEKLRRIATENKWEVLE